jgi:hypothetical protein
VEGTVGQRVPLTVAPRFVAAFAQLLVRSVPEVVALRLRPCSVAGSGAERSALSPSDITESARHGHPLPLGDCHRFREEPAGQLVFTRRHTERHSLVRCPIELGRSACARTTAAGRASVLGLEQTELSELVEMERSNSSGNAKSLSDLVPTALVCRRGDEEIHVSTQGFSQRGDRRQSFCLRAHGDILKQTYLDENPSIF